MTAATAPTTTRYSTSPTQPAASTDETSQRRRQHRPTAGSRPQPRPERMARSARTEQAGWPLAHPPTHTPVVLWFPDSASAARLRRYWLDFSAREVATAAEAARRHAPSQQPGVRGDGSNAGSPPAQSAASSVNPPPSSASSTQGPGVDVTRSRSANMSSNTSSSAAVSSRARRSASSGCIPRPVAPSASRTTALYRKLSTCSRPANSAASTDLDPAFWPSGGSGHGPVPDASVGRRGAGSAGCSCVGNGRRTWPVLAQCNRCSRQPGSTSSSHRTSSAMSQEPAGSTAMPPALTSSAACAGSATLTVPVKAGGSPRNSERVTYHVCVR